MKKHLISVAIFLCAYFEAAEGSSLSSSNESALNKLAADPLVQSGFNLYIDGSINTVSEFKQGLRDAFMGENVTSRSFNPIEKICIKRSIIGAGAGAPVDSQLSSGKHLKKKYSIMNQIRLISASQSHVAFNSPNPPWARVQDFVKTLQEVGLDHKDIYKIPLCRMRALFSKYILEIFYLIYAKNKKPTELPNSLFLLVGYFADSIILFPEELKNVRCLDKEQAAVKKEKEDAHKFIVKFLENGHTDFKANDYAGFLLETCLRNTVLGALEQNHLPKKFHKDHGKFLEAASKIQRLLRFKKYCIKRRFKK